MTTKQRAHQNQIIAEIVAALKEKLTELEKQPGRCEACPAGPCEFCEFLTRNEIG
jgi:hypothetical protein